ncbi:tyrosine-type recombinase/integrase [Bacteriovorax sp. PP10]|uniref:Tyrosine-type recombinase/integrase n=1 Tax=Bacteriovorax antarcticus TaxID=3088717 RepID=A0ABU5W1Y3_9BACT|nr:tyrosine-type recombinase/integrase [Bacteriovorax sp. PP10]MEA9358265.1 tyrosine-type recombinase/integrase [Bacteriovorax sp. PP10]
MNTPVRKNDSSLKVHNQGSFNYKLEYEFFSNFESLHTRKSYRIDITQFFEFLKENFREVNGYTGVERVHVVAFRNWLTDNGLAPKSINRKIAANSSFFDFLIEKSMIQFNPCSSIKRPRQEVVQPTNDLSDDQISDLLSLIEDLKGPGLLHKAVIYTLFTTGIRKAELINLRRKNFSIRDSHYVIEVRAKGGKQLTKVVHPKCAEVILEYINHLESSGEKVHAEDWIFRPSKNPLEPTHIIKPLNPKSVDYIVKTWCKKAGIHHRISPHSARASYIGSALDAGIDLYKVSKDVGHASVKTTEEYNKRRQKMEDSPVFGLGFLKAKKES